ncbi:acetyltransferase component of pyruvate dehydrogenase complex [Arthrobacter sp. NicSoilB4]|uniref:dihydrolipoamide acetyltransferase family protein n=1 Tax=Arthrobacter sp. NicSoilB4 TaxID=2830997 RepID=UPI001CC4F37E|nr:dihydrolipoamide acetyltransferase family protein [Arthrobacter sp. NicSoilB4]BCW65611.1 acetyltransferase component of pyruvate dehydrogenase complex [Arthrobacter sp. NicSoilB4]
MADFLMPSLGADMEHGKIVEWLVKPGDYVRRGDLVAVVDTDKTVMDVESFQEGVVAELLVDPGATVPIGTPLARITPTPAETGTGTGTGAPVPPPAPVPSSAAGAPPARAAAAPTAAVQTAAVQTAPGDAPPIAPPLRHLAHRLGVDPARIHGTGKGGAITRADVEHAVAARPSAGRVRSSPRARRLAAELGVELASVSGTGPEGAVTVADVQLAAGSRTPAAVPVAGGPGEGVPEAGTAGTAPPPEGQATEAPQAGKTAEARERVASLRRAVGALMSRSKKTIPHYYLSTTLDLRAAVEWMQSVNAQRPVASRLVPSALLLKAAALAAKDVQEVNGFYDDGGFRPSASVHLGVAVALRQGGIVAPAIHDADTLAVDVLMEQLRDLVSRARAGRLQRAEMADPTITVTNLGDLGVESVFGVIYPPQVAMLGLGRVMEQPWAQNGMLGIRPAVIATLSADHRVSDGLRGGRYLTRIDELLQKPEEL